MAAITEEPVRAPRAVRAARAWLGTPYHHQAQCLGIGVDCLGLLMAVYCDVVGAAPETPPPYTADWAEAHGCETLLEAADRHLLRVKARTVAAGDVLIFRYRAAAPAKHCAIATGPERIIHAVERRGVVEVPLAAAWQRRIAGHFAFPERTL